MRADIIDPWARGVYDAPSKQLVCFPVQLVSCTDSDDFPFILDESVRLHMVHRIGAEFGSALQQSNRHARVTRPVFRVVAAALQTITPSQRLFFTHLINRQHAAAFIFLHLCEHIVNAQADTCREVAESTALME